MPFGGVNHSLPPGAGEGCSMLAVRVLCPGVRSCLQKQLPKALSDYVPSTLLFVHVTKTQQGLGRHGTPRVLLSMVV